MAFLIITVPFVPYSQTSYYKYDEHEEESQQTYREVSGLVSSKLHTCLKHALVFLATSERNAVSPTAESLFLNHVLGDPSHHNDPARPEDFLQDAWSRKVALVLYQQSSFPKTSKQAKRRNINPHLHVFLQTLAKNALHK